MIRWVVGLGNPGEQYAGTRHNAGFEVLDLLASEAPMRWRSPWLWPAWSATWHLGERPPVRLVKPRTFMNRSGRVLHRARRERVHAAELLIIYDDLDVPCGQLRVRASGGHGGHNGLRALMDTWGTKDFPRVRVGIGPRPSGAELIDYVLGHWSPEQQPAWEAARRRAVAAVTLAVQTSVDQAMNEFNRAA